MPKVFEHMAQSAILCCMCEVIPQEPLDRAHPPGNLGDRLAEDEFDILCVGLANILNEMLQLTTQNRLSVADRRDIATTTEVPTLD